MSFLQMQMHSKNTNVNQLKTQLDNLINEDTEYKSLKETGERLNPIYFIKKNQDKFNNME